MPKRRNPDGDAPLWKLAIFELKCFVKRRLAPKGIPVATPERPYLVVPILGQSNAFGMGLPLDRQDAATAHPWVHQWANSGPSKNTVVLGIDPLLHETPSRRVGFGVTFGKELATATNRAVLLVPCARGDTSFHPKNGYTWDIADTTTRRNLYREAVSAIDAALARYPGSSVAAVLWHQGESDVPLMSAAEYQAKLDSLFGDLRSRYGSEVPIILGGMVPEEMERSGKDYAPINAVHADTPHRIPRTAFVPGIRGAFNSDVDRHYNADGLRAMGEAMWAAYRTIDGTTELRPES
ncbi:sialate O-acetylesterase [Mycolicibacterium sp. J2]|uniref:sialate O-acetylesterase n=1 Tax=Mycolicibacterium sp. J2 TaxID=2993511 RepID=UPI00224B8008|nr:sialate O-acetylesterase [Mycolicibacterium sp. J2]MCX2713206.1 sialate O-acetylesterase [Mycolicibacterium sp. J2]